MIGSLAEWQAERIERELTESLTKTVRLEVYISTVHSLMQSRGFSRERAMDVLEIPKSMRADVTRALSR